MYIIIAGIGRIGYTLGKSLSERYDVVLIDINKKICDKVAKEIDALVINGDCTKTKTLEDAGIDDADIYIAVTGKDEVNLISCLLAKKYYGVEKTISRISEIEYKDIFERLGVDIVISPELIAAHYIEKLIERPGVLDLTIIGRGEAEIIELIIPEDSEVANKKIKELKKPEDYLIIAVYEGNNLKIPSGETVLKPGDRVLVLVKKDKSEIIRRMFRGEK
ncbi:TRK system potassium uptake protein TrkA [Methanocaldococcus villosus KIN24-T80]|uniref:TRK system potassium uptake protein TrkA n=1 Tax=Methanocaldococcus villosus KIN24-T80 TaxID=1069083 RepID=N6UTI8_9EURY|nr:TrkA family potassium uptake protein [Methanocaldococcus villosus]ENN95634.1 TRK system potassium uptake protein TrkA [Methanocaldococcus villosus KIN24-T80]